MAEATVILLKINLLFSISKYFYVDLENISIDMLVKFSFLRNLDTNSFVAVLSQGITQKCLLFIRSFLPYWFVSYVKSLLAIFPAERLNER